MDPSVAAPPAQPCRVAAGSPCGTWPRVSSGGRYLDRLYLRAALRCRVRAIYAGAAGYLPSRSGFRVVLLGARW